MTDFKQITRVEKNSHNNQPEMTYLSDMHTLQENNRDLAKRLADQRKENSELKEVEQKFIILENKFKIYRDLHQASLSKLEEMFNKTCSELSIVLDNLVLLYTTIKEEQTKADYIIEGQDECSNTCNVQQLPDALNHMASVLNEVRTSAVEDSYSLDQSVCTNVEDRGFLSARDSFPDTTSETVEKFPKINPMNSTTNTVVEKSLESNSSLGETYHFSLDESFRSIIVDDETIVRRGGGDSVIEMKDMDFHTSKKNCTENFAQDDDMDESIISRRRLSDMSRKSNSENEETYYFSKIANMKRREFDSGSETFSSTHSSNHSCRSPKNAELKRNSLRNVSVSNSGSILNSTIKEAPESFVQSSPRRFQILNQPQRSSVENTPPRNLREDKSKHINKIQDDFIYSDPQTPKICIQRYRYFFTLGDKSGSRGACMSDAKENIGSSSSQGVQKSYFPPAQLQRKPLQERKKETIIISNQNIKKASPADAAACSSEKRSWLRGPRNFDTDVSMPTSYSSFRSMKLCGQETKEREGTSKTSRTSNKKSRRKPRVKKKENIRL